MSGGLGSRTTAPGIRLHQRTLHVQAASARMMGAVLAVVEEYELTAGEVVKLLALESVRYSNYVLRDERHPDDPDKKADEA